MRINELTIPPTRQDAGAILRKAGYQPLGKGSFASVWIKPGEPFALKLFSTVDKGYWAFIQLVQQFPNPHFPVIRGKPIKVTDRYNAVRIEMLPAPIARFWRLIRECGSYLGALQFADDGSLGRNSRNEYLAEIKRFRRQYRSLSTAIDLIYHNIVKGNPNMLNDIDIRNCRVRGTTLVFIDPIGWGGGPMIFGEGDEPSEDELKAIAADKMLKNQPRARDLRFTVAGNDSTYPAL